MMKLTRIVFFLFFFIPCLGVSAELEIRTQSDGGVSSGTSVLIWKKTAQIHKEKPDVSLLTDKNGIVSTDLAKGEYYIFAEKKRDNSRFFGFYGMNPLRLSDRSQIRINLVKLPVNPVEQIAEKVICGIVSYKGVPLNDVEIYAYLDLSSDLKGPSYLMTRSDATGAFTIPVESGNYYLVFRKKTKNTFGPPEPGDYIGVFPEFPLMITNAGVRIRVELMQVPDKIKESIKNSKAFLVKGRIFDKKKNALKNRYAGLYATSEMLGRPIYVSGPSDGSGNYWIPVKQEGEYYLAVRERLGDTPQLDEKFFIYGKVVVTQGKETIQLDITVNE